jgi:LysM repeat protein
MSLLLRRARLLVLAATVLIPLAAACGDDSEPPRTEGTATPTVIATATPFASIPEPTIVSGTETPPPDEITYIVEPGDTLSALAEQFGTTPEAITERNGLTDEFLFVGQELIIPAPADDGGTDDGSTDGEEEPTSEPTAEATEEPTEEPTATATPEATATQTPEAGGQTYVVQDGDTATGIADQFGITLEELAAANGLTVADLDNLFVGQELVIPGQ